MAQDSPAPNRPSAMIRHTLYDQSPASGRSSLGATPPPNPYPQLPLSSKSSKSSNRVSMTPMMAVAQPSPSRSRSTSAESPSVRQIKYQNGVNRMSSMHMPGAYVGNQSIDEKSSAMIESSTTEDEPLGNHLELAMNEKYQETRGRLDQRASHIVEGDIAVIDRTDFNTNGSNTSFINGSNNNSIHNHNIDSRDEVDEVDDRDDHGDGSMRQVGYMNGYYSPEYAQPIPVGNIVAPAPVAPATLAAFPPAVPLAPISLAVGAAQSVSSNNTSRSMSPNVTARTLTIHKSMRRAGGPVVNNLTSAGEDMNSAFYTPLPLNGNPTEVLSHRFSIWRKVLKEMIAYFKEVASMQDARSRLSYKLGSTVVAVPFRETGTMFMRHSGIQETAVMMRDYHKQSALHSADAAKQILEQIVPRLEDLRRDLTFKIKEIKSLAGDFKNNVIKEQDLTRKQVVVLTEALSAMAVNPHLVTGKYDPYIVKLGVEKQLRRQIEEENYLHQAYLNIESSGQALEEIVVKEIEQAYGMYCAFLTREGQETLDFSQRLMANTVRLPPTKEWMDFVLRDPNFIDPMLPVRKFENIRYPGREDPATKPVRAGALERRTKYLKSYTSAWYVLTPSHLHEFKSSDRKSDLTPVMSLLLQDCHVAEHSDAKSQSYKFLMKGKQTGQFHRGHSWMFKADSYESMMRWYEDIKRFTDPPSGQSDGAAPAAGQRAVSSPQYGESRLSFESKAETERTF